ncbi:MAG TPA: GDP-mannose 4,6-dehydratase, partial [Vicinamibacteria bacterium]
MRVLVTGVSGFVGGHVVDMLRREQPGAEVVGLDSRPGNRARALGIEVLPADLQDAAAVRHALDRVRPQRVVHLAAQSSPQRSWEDPAGTLKTNLLGLLHLLEGARTLAL